MMRDVLRLRTNWMVLTLAVALSGCSDPDLSDLQQFVAATKAKSAGQPLEPLPEVKPYEPFLYQAQGLRNPFSVAEFIREAEAEAEAEILAELDNGISPDPDRVREELERYSLGSLTMVGTYRQQDSQELWALIRAPDGIIHRVREGNYMGNDHGEILEISEDRIELLEIVRDGERRWRERDAFLSLSE